MLIPRTLSHLVGANASKSFLQTLTGPACDVLRRELVGNEMLLPTLKLAPVNHRCRLYAPFPVDQLPANLHPDTNLGKRGIWQV